MKPTFFKFIALAALCAFTPKAYATTQTADNIKCVPYALSQSENGASLLSCYGTIASVCQTVVYVAHEDKHLLATVLSAQAQSLRVNIIYNDAAPLVTLGAFGGMQRQCKLLSAEVNNNAF